jgi:hypothetical protein
MQAFLAAGERRSTAKPARRTTDWHRRAMPREVMTSYDYPIRRVIICKSVCVPLSTCFVNCAAHDR